MRKIILFLALALGVEVNAQVVGGYIPINSSKTPTMGGLRVTGNETVVGTLSVGSTATVTGNALFSSSVNVGAFTPNSSLGSFHVSKGSGLAVLGEYTSGRSALWLGTNTSFTPTSSNFAIGGDGANIYLNTSSTIFMRNGGTNLFSATTTSITNHVPLTVLGNLTTTGTHSLGSANLTGGSTGTVAVLSDAVYSMWFGAGQVGAATNPADGTSYYVGNTGCWSNASTSNSLTVPYNSTLVGYDIQVFVNNTIGSNESVTLAIQGTTNYTMTTSMTYSLGGAQSTSTTGLSQSFGAGDKIFIRQFSPTWVTNPTLVSIGITLWFVRRT